MIDTNFNQNENINVSKEVSSLNDTFSNKGRTNTKLISHDFNLEDLKRHLYWKFVNTNSIALSGEISPERVRQILNGFELPKSPSLINQLARGWDIDPIKLTLCFERFDGKVREVADDKTN